VNDDKCAKKRILTVEFILLFIATFTFVLSVGVLSPFLPIFASSLGATESLVGIIMGVFFAVGLLTRIPYGSLIDAYGKRLMMMVGAVIYTVAPLLYLFCSDPLHMFIIRVFHGFGMGAFQISATALAADLAPDDRLGETIAMYSVAPLVGMAMGPALGGFTAEYMGMDTNFLMAGGLGLLAITCSFMVRDYRAPSGRREFAIRPVISDRNVVSSAVIMFFVSISWASVGTFFPLHAADNGLALASIGLFFTTYSITTVVSRPLIGKISDMVDRSLIIVFTAGIAVVSMVILALGTTFEVFILAAVVYAIGYGSCYTLISALAVDTVDANLRGSAIAFSYMGKDVGVMVGSMALGFLAQALGFVFLYLAVSGVLVAGIVVFIVIRLLMAEKVPNLKDRK